MCVLSAMVGGVAVAGAQTPPATAADAPQGPIVAVHHEPHHRQVFQYGPMRILDLQLPPGDISWFHTHEWPVFYLTTSDSPTVSQNLGEEWGAGRGRAGGAARGSAAAPGGPTAAPAAGRAGAPARGGRGGRPRLMSDVSYAERTVTHRIRNDGTSLFRAMVVVNETRGGDEAVTEAAAGFEGKALSSNRWFRAYRIALEPGAKTAPHEHKAPVVVLQDTPGKGIGTGPMKFEFNEPGQWGFFDAGTRHEIANTGDGPVEFIEVEVRR
jgi:quercetin dioxygenase-like cupin family protein